MRIRLVTTIFKPFNQVYKSFNKTLFDYLLPPFGLAAVERYEGQNPGDIIEIRFRIPFLGNWTVIVKETWLNHHEYGFVDRGLRIPFGIVYWKHIHRVVARNNTSSFIIDDIEFETRSKIIDYLLYIIILMIFYPRKFLYKRFFKKLYV